MGPLEVFYCWQSLLCACAIVGIMKAIVALIDLRIGKEARQANKALSYFALPMLTVIIGFLFAVIVPMHPETLETYVEHHVASDMQRAYLVYGAWGAACGQFAQTLYDRASDLMKSKTGRGLPGASDDVARPAAGGTGDRP